MSSPGDFEDKLRSDYLQEAKELLADAESCFLRLEKDPGNRELIDRIFRMIHTVKGSGSIVGFDSFTRFTHQFESLLALIRSGDLSIDTDIIDLMFAANDQLKDWVQELEQDYAFEMDTSFVVSRLGPYLHASAAPAPAKDSSAAFGFFEDETPGPDLPLVLLVDDETDILNLYETYLDGMPVRTLRALDGREAVAQLERHLPDVIVLDLRMPAMDGMEFLQHVRKKLPDVPVLFVSGYSDRSDIINMLNQGAFAFMNKPVTREFFLNQVRNGLRERATRRQVMQLTQLNFMAFLTLDKIAHCREAAARKDQESKMKGILDTIVDVQDSILEAKFPHLVE